MANKVKHTCC